jgi:hypothetical protein
MSLDQAVWALLLAAIVLANVPWMLDKRLFFFIPVESKKFVYSASEWFLYFLVIGGLATLLEYTSMGHIAPQDWEFYVVNLFLFAIFAFPGFIYRYNYKTLRSRKVANS